MMARRRLRPPQAASRRFWAHNARTCDAGLRTKLRSAIEPALMMETALVIKAGPVTDIERGHTIIRRDAIDALQDEDAVTVVMVVVEASPITGLRLA
jgi:hypothetical protein